MISLKNNAWLLSLVFLISACLQETETDLDRAIARDNSILEQYINSNEIDATKVQSGFYYHKTTSQPEAEQFENGDFVGVYYEIKTIDGQLIESYMDETKEPLIFKYSQEGLWPVVMAYAAGLSRVGEEITIYSPSYLAFGNYGFEQLILPASNLVIEAKFVKKYTQEGLKQRELEIISNYIEDNNLEGFEEISEGIFARTIVGGDESKVASSLGSNVTFDFQLFELGETDPIFNSFEDSAPTTANVGNSSLTFLNEGLKGVYPDQEIEVLATSFASYVNAIQVIPYSIRADLVELGEFIDLVRPFTPVLLKAEILAVQ